MTVAKKLLHYENYNYDEIAGKLKEEGFDIAYGSTYTLPEIRKAISDQQPVFLKTIKDELLFVIGETEKSIVVLHDNRKYEIPDTILNKAWSGEATIVIEEKRSILKADNLEPAKWGEIDCKLDMVIFVPERNNWDSEFNTQKISGREQIKKINNLELEFLPTHPVIVIFQIPSEKFKKEGVRAANNGVEIQIYDPTDPFTEFLHELGHIYYMTRLTDVEKEECDKLQKTLRKETLPAIFLSNWSWSKGVEVFATVYSWYIRGKLLHSGYIKILQEQFQPGHEYICAIFERIRQGYEMQVALKAKKQQCEQTWNTYEKSLAKWINNRTGQPSLTKVHGKESRLIKSQLPCKEELPKRIEIPAFVKTDTLWKYGQREWMRINNGILNGKVIVTKDGCIDQEYMSTHKRFHKAVPYAKMSVKNGKQVKRITHISISKLNLLKKAEVNNNKVEERPQVKNTIKTVLKEYWKHLPLRRLLKDGETTI